MRRWPKKPLGELVLPIEQRDPRDTPSEEFLYVDIASVDNKIKIITEAKKFLGAKAPSRARKVIRSGDVIVSTVRPNLNAVALIPDSLDTQICSTGFSVLRPTEQVLSAYLFAFARSAFFIDALVRRTTGANYPAVNDGDVKEVPVPVPPLSEQKRIIRLLNEADELRKLRARADQRTTAMLPALFDEMFGDAEQNLVKWPTKRVDEVCNLVRGSSPRPKSDPRYYGGPIPRLTIEDITRDGWSVTPRVDSLTELGATMSRPVKAGTIVMAVSGNVGLCAQLAVDACVHDGFVAFKDLDNDLFVPLFFGMAMSQMRQSHKRNQAGAIFQNITTTDVKQMIIPVPPLHLQKEFVKRVVEVRELEAVQAASKARLDDLFQSMLHRAFNGEL